MLLMDKNNDKNYCINTHDRAIIQGYIPRCSYSEDMTSFLKAIDIHFFDFSTTLRNKSDRMHSTLLKRMDSKLNSFVKTRRSVKTIGYSRSFLKSEKKAGSYFFCYGTVYGL